MIQKNNFNIEVLFLIFSIAALSICLTRANDMPSLSAMILKVIGPFSYIDIKQQF